MVMSTCSSKSFIYAFAFHRTSIMIGTALKVSEMSKVMLFSTYCMQCLYHSKIYTAAYLPYGRDGATMGECVERWGWGCVCISLTPLHRHHTINKGNVCILIVYHYSILL